MKRLLGSLLVLSALAVQAACGGEESEPRADDPSTQVETDAADPQVVDIVSGSAAGGDVAEAATVIDGDAALTRYLRQFGSPAFTDDLTAAIEAHEPADGRVLGLAVIEISCDEPPSADVTQVGGRFLVTAGKVVSPHPECYVPVTSVAVLDLPA